jgi:hypothetical protein
MRAFHDIRAQMRENAIRLTNPATEPRTPVQVSRPHATANREDFDARIDSWMVEAFGALITARETNEPFFLLPCSVNGERTAAIVHVSHMDDANRAHVTPLFVAMTPGMVLIDHKGRRAGTVT